MNRTNTAVWHDKHQRWQINVQKDGERRSFYSSTPGRNGQREANKKADEWLDSGLVNPATKINVLFNNWIEELKVTTSFDNWNQYFKYGKNRILPKIGNVRAGSLTEQQLQNILIIAHKDGLAKKTISNIRGCLTAFVRYMRKCKASSLVVENLYVPKGAPVKEKTILQPKDLLLLFSCDNTIMRGVEVPDMFVNAYRFEVATGLRPGEVIGLMHSDIKSNKIHLKRSINLHGIETKGKNENAARTFILTDIAIGILKDQAKMISGLDIESNYVFPNKYGEPISQSTYYKRWIRYRDYMGLSKACPYELRHTFVSIVKQLPEGLLKPLVGHSKDMDTFGTYSHEVEGDMQTAAELIQSTFSKLIKK